MTANNSGKLRINKINGNCNVESEDILAKEEPLEISVMWSREEKYLDRKISVTMRTPGNDEELSAGFLFTEGIINGYADIREINAQEENKITVNLKNGILPSLQQSDRNFYTTSSCGVCGKASLEAIRTVSLYTTITSDLLITPDLLFSLPEKIRRQQKIFEQTGGLHASALFDHDGKLFLLREDVGRHNALDKLIGAAMKEDLLPLKEFILLLSGRASFELIQKATMAGIKIVAAIGAPSTLAAELAANAGITLLGFLKDGSFNIYTCRERIILKDSI